MSQELPPNTEVIERGWLSANLVIFQGPEGNAAVDSGYVSHSGQTVELVRTAPLGDPMELRIRGYELSLRRQQASNAR